MAPGSRTSLVNVRPMPMIHEDEDAPAPPLPDRSLRRSAIASPAPGGINGWPRPASTGSSNGGGHYPSYGPPPYSEYGDAASKPDRKTLPVRDGIRENEWFTKRGGWCRLAVMSAVLIVIIVGLGVGLSIGLRKKQVPHSPVHKVRPMP
jgi:hypothetical protein